MKTELNIMAALHHGVGPDDIKDQHISFIFHTAMKELVNSQTVV